MKLKGVNWFEGNVEKVALGVGALALAGTFGLQMFTQPNMVKVGTQTFTPQRAVDPVNSAAQLLDDQMKVADPKLPPQPDSNLLDKLKVGVTNPVAPPQRVALGRSPNIGQGTRTGAVEVDYASLTVPAPTELAAVSFGSTIHPMEAQAHPDLAKWLPKEQPFDKQAVTVGATFNAVDLKNALLLDPDGEGPIMPIPQSWWKNPLNPSDEAIDIIAVQLERETITPAEDSKDSPGTIIMVDSMPGREDPFKMWTNAVKSVGDAGSGLTQIRQLAEQVARPAYYATIAGQPWSEPNVLAVQVKEGDNKVAAERLAEGYKRDLDKLNKQIDELKPKIDAAPEPGQRRDQPPPPGRGRGPGPAQPSPSTPPSGPDKRQLQIQLKGLETRKATLVKKLAALGIKDADIGEVAAGAAPVATPFLDNPEVKIWAHDISAVPGATYRYRIRVVINNPVFSRQVRATQTSLAEKSYIEGPWSDWSNPVDVDRNDYFFVTAASDGTNNAVNPRPHASAELFKFYYGFWRKASIGAEPGDKLEGNAKLPELDVFDLKKIAAGDPALPPGNPPPPPPPPSRGPGRTAAQPDDRGGPAPGGPAQPPLGLAGVANTPLPRDLPIRVDAYFLDAYRLPVGSLGVGGGVKETMEALLRGVGGNVISRIPDLERSQDRYKRLETSAKLGLNQGKPEAKPIDDKKQPVGPDKPPPPKTNRPGGGGG